MIARRTAGVGLLCFALLCSVLIGKAGVLSVSGAAVRSPGLGLPAVAGCVKSVSGPISTGADPSPVSIDSVGETAVTFGDCAGEHAGEVVAVRRMPAQSTATGAEDSDGEWCQQVAVGYRSHSLDRLRDVLLGPWVPSAGHRFVVILSAPARDPAEPRWAACAVVPPGLETYRGSYVHSLARAPAPAPFGLCSSGDEAARWVSCVMPHRTQVFGTAAGSTSSAPQAVAACRALIEAMTGMTDISADGVLRAAARPDGVGNSSRAARCELSVIGGAQLIGSLIGNGPRPLPLA